MMTTTPRVRRTALGCVAAVVLLAAACSNGEQTAEPIGDPVADEAEAAPSWLFTQTSTGGTFSTDAAGIHTLTLTGVDRGVTAFTDRPDRDASVVSTEQFVGEWPSMFADSAPNAVLVEHEPSGESNSFVVTLFDPVLDGSTLSFRAEIVDAEDHSDQLPGLTDAPHSEPPARFDTVSLFIDNVPAGVPTGNCGAPPAPGVDWTRCDMYGRNVSGADLSKATLASTDLVDANLSGSNLSSAAMMHAGLSNANLRGANLSGADLSYANLRGADLRGANVTGANFTGVSWYATHCPDGSMPPGTNPCPL